MHSPALALSKHRRPATSCSWLNAVEGFFATLTKRRLKRGVFRSIFDLQVSINLCLKEHNTQSKPFVWSAGSVLNHHRMSDLGIEFRCKHPSCPSMPVNDIETA